MVEGEIYTGAIAELYGLAMLSIWHTWVVAWNVTWNIPMLYACGKAGYGHLIYLGSGIETYGPTQLLVHKFRYEGYAGAPEKFRVIAEAWFAPVGFGTFLVKLYLTIPGTGEWFNVELLSIELVSPQPRPNVVISAELDKMRLKPDEYVTINIVTSNTGNAIGAHNLTISVDGRVEKSWLVILNPGESESLSHELSFPSEGTYVVAVDGQAFNVVVSTIPPARFEVSGLSISPSSVKVGQTSTISVTVRNAGGEAGTYELTLKVNNEVVGTKSVTLGPGQSTTVSFTYTPPSEGTYSIEVDGLTGSLTVSKEGVGEETAPGTPEIPWLIIIGAVVTAVALAIVMTLLRRAAGPRT